MPLRNGKFLDEDECRGIWASSTGMWNQWIQAVKNYAESREVSDGAVCKPLTFLRKKWKDWEQPESKQGEPLGQSVQQPGVLDRSWLDQAKKDEEMVRQGHGLLAANKRE
jgi:hypothetical protein